MKLLKSVLAVLMTVTLSVTVTSCLKDEYKNQENVLEFARVDADVAPVTFVNSSGVTLSPKTPILSVEGDDDMALLAYQYDTSKSKDNPQYREIALYGDPVYFSASEVSEDETLEANAPVVTLTPAVDYVAYSGLFFDENTLILPIGFKAKSCISTTEQQTEYDAHSFVLTYSESDQSGSALTLRLKHIIDDSKVEMGSGIRTLNSLVFRAFDLSPLWEKLMVRPSSIIVKVEENTSSDSYDGVQDKSYEYTYGFSW